MYLSRWKPTLHRSVVAIATVHLVLQRPLFSPFLNITRGLKVAGKEGSTFAKESRKLLREKQSRPQTRTPLRDRRLSKCRQMWGNTPSWERPQSRQGLRALRRAGSANSLWLLTGAVNSVILAIQAGSQVHAYCVN